MYVVRVRFPPHGMDAPHWHPKARYVTVLDGTWYAGTGDTFDVTKAVPLKAGSFMLHPAKAVHWDGCTLRRCGHPAVGMDPVLKVDESIQALETKLKQLKTLEARMAARACTTAAKKFRGEELRRRILAGAVLLDGALTREEDRELFGLGEK
jgi:Cupin